MNRKTVLISLLAVAASGALYFARAKVTTPANPDPKPPVARPVVAAGRTEPASEELEIGTELDGRLRRVPVDEGQPVRRGQVIAELENADFAARLERSAAEIADREAALARARAGSRPMQRRETSAAIREAEAVLDNAASERQRRSVLLERGAISRSEYDTADREFRVAQARLDAVRERHALVEDEVRPEDIRRAEAELDRARAMRAEAQAMLAKTVVRSPIDGIVLRRHKKSGESVSTQDRQPILTLGDISHLRVRAEVDETDVSRVHEGQSVYVTAPAYGGRRFAGRVIRVGRILGRKKIFSDAPNERVDTKVLETLIELDSGHTLPAGLRVDTFIEAAAPRN